MQQQARLHLAPFQRPSDHDTRCRPLRDYRWRTACLLSLGIATVTIGAAQAQQQGVPQQEPTEPTVNAGRSEPEALDATPGSRDARSATRIEAAPAADLVAGWRVWIDPVTGRLVSTPPEGSTPAAAAPLATVRRPQIRNFSFVASEGRTVQGAFLDGAFQSAMRVHVHRRSATVNGTEIELTTTCRDLHPNTGDISDTRRTDWADGLASDGRAVSNSSPPPIVSAPVGDQR